MWIFYSNKMLTNVLTLPSQVSLMHALVIYQLHLLSTWGDLYYVGMNGLEFYNADGNRITLTENSKLLFLSSIRKNIFIGVCELWNQLWIFLVADISAYPDSINVLEGVTTDVRTPDKLVNGINDTQDGRQMWLAPIIPSVVSLIIVRVKKISFVHYVTLLFNNAVIFYNN